MFIININNISRMDNLFIYHIYKYYFILCIDKISIHNKDKYAFSIPDIENSSIPHIDKSIFVYIAYGHFVYT